MKLLEYFHLADLNQPLRIQRERRGRGRFVGWLVSLSVFLVLVGLVAFTQQLPPAS